MNKYNHYLIITVILAAMAICLVIADNVFHISTGYLATTIIILILIAGFTYAGLKNLKISRLKKDGIKLLATINYISLEVHNYASRGGASGRLNSFKIHCTYQNPNTNQAVECESDAMRFEPDLQLNNTSIDVYVDKNNSNNYWVDISKIKLRTRTAQDSLAFSMQHRDPGLYKSFDGLIYTYAE